MAVKRAGEGLSRSITAITAPLRSTGTTISNADGSYVFDNLPAGVYSIVVNGGVTPSGYSQSADPDGVLDNATSPLVLAAGDVFVNADFGYQPDAGNGADIGDRVWLDLDGNDNDNSTSGS